MCCGMVDDNDSNGKQLENCLKSLIMDQLETHELWEIDDCICLLFDLGYSEE